MTDEEIRSLVREAVARRAASTAVSGQEPTAALRLHASQALFRLGPGGDADGMCVIEPSVRCVHCGYCQTYGH
jgi:hypothetical protein